METVAPQPVMGQEGPNRLPPEWSRTYASRVHGGNPSESSDHEERRFQRPPARLLDGLPGKIADNFNEIVTANEQMAQELKRVGQAVGKEGKTRERIRVRAAPRRLGRHGSLGQHAGRRPASSHDRGHARDRRRRPRQPDADSPARRGWPPPGGRVPAFREHREHDDSAARRLYGRGDARGPRSGHRRKARRPGGGARRGRNLEGSDGFRELHGQQPYRPGAKHRRGCNGRGQRRPFPQDHGRCARRNSAAERSHQHDGGSAALVRIGSDARGARSGHRRQARRPGGGAGRGRNLEGSDRLRERDGRQPYGAGEKHRRSDNRRGPRRFVAQNHRGREGRNSRA